MKPERKARILVIDDEEGIRKSLKMILEYEGYEFFEAGTGEDGLEMLRETVGIDLVLLDIKMPGRSGLEVLAELRERPFVPEVIMISGQGTIQAAVEATKLGAFDFLEKPLHRERVLISIRNALKQTSLSRECQDLKKKAEKRYEIVGNHPLIQNLWKEILKIAPTNATVLVHGESGTGKELIARSVHAHSLRARETFVQVNCAAIPEELIESELFGHEKGSFTGATEKKTGKFEQADGGTIFLDEIGDMSLRTQSKVLRVLEEGEVQKVGSSKIAKVDVRVIAATNKDLRKEIQEGRFREDLYFRLNVAAPLFAGPAGKGRGYPGPHRLLLADLRRGEQFQVPEVLRGRPRGHVPLRLEGQRPRAQERRRTADDHDRPRNDRGQGPAGRPAGEGGGRPARGGRGQDAARVPRPGRTGFPAGQARGQRLEHLPDGPGDRHAAIEPL